MIELIYAFGALSAVALLLEVVARATPAAVAQMPKVREARERHEAVEAKAKLMLAEIAGLKQQRDKLADELMLFEARLKDAKQRALAHAAGQTIFVIELGKNAPDRKLYEAYVCNPAVRAANRPANVERVNAIFANPQLVEVWAEGLMEARQLLDRQFPREDGYEIEYTDQMIEAVQQAG
jgi:hypothetical protein